MPSPWMSCGASAPATRASAAPRAGTSLWAPSCRGASSGPGTATSSQVPPPTETYTCKQALLGGSLGSGPVLRVEVLSQQDPREGSPREVSSSSLTCPLLSGRLGNILGHTQDNGVWFCGGYQGPYLVTQSGIFLGGVGGRPSALALGLVHTVLAPTLSSPVTGHLGDLVGKWPAIYISAEEDTFTQHLPYAIGRALPGC